MSWLIGRASALLFALLAVALIFWIIPANTDPGYAGSLQPSTLPTIAAALMGIGALLSLVERGGRDRPDTALLRQAMVFVLVLVAATSLTHLIGFKWVAPLLCLVTMLIAGERRLPWLTTGTLLVPALTWLVFELGLGRPLP